MGEYLRIEPGKTYFLTCTVTDWVDVFTRYAWARVIEDALVHSQQHKGLQLYGWVLMTNHLHLIAGRETDTLSTLLRDFKSYTASALLKGIQAEAAESRRVWMLERFALAGHESTNNKTYQFWQETNHPEALISRTFTEQKLKYMYTNPVKAGFVAEGSHWRWCGWHPDTAAKCLPI